MDRANRANRALTDPNLFKRKEVRLARGVSDLMLWPYTSMVSDLVVLSPASRPCIGSDKTCEILKVLRSNQSIWNCLLPFLVSWGRSIFRPFPSRLAQECPRTSSSRSRAPKRAQQCTIYSQTPLLPLHYTTVPHIYISVDRSTRNTLVHVRVYEYVLVRTSRRGMSRCRV